MIDRDTTGQGGHPEDEAFSIWYKTTIYLRCSGSRSLAVWLEEFKLARSVAPAGQSFH
jgi:hypothetical protein